LRELRSLWRSRLPRRSLSLLPPPIEPRRVAGSQTTCSTISLHRVAGGMHYVEPIEGALNGTPGGVTTGITPGRQKARGRGWPSSTASARSHERERPSVTIRPPTSPPHPRNFSSLVFWDIDPAASPRGLKVQGRRTDPKGRATSAKIQIASVLCFHPHDGQ
jgi:hypothetical protein